MLIRAVCILATAFVLATSLFGAAPTTLDNNDSCDISLTPAATLLLPYFEVALDDPLGETTLITVTNTGAKAQVARVTLWTDHSFPVVTFNIYLTGYDMQSLSLYDVIARGQIAAPRGTGVSVSPEGAHSDSNHLVDVTECGSIPTRLEPSMVTRMRHAFLLGDIGGGCNKVGAIHENAVGYATIDVVGNCAVRGPGDPQYFAEDLRFANVLIGDYQQVNSARNFAQGNAMVHIRAIPAGGTPQTRAVLPGYTTPFDHTFYERFHDTAHRGMDARQPLPSAFGARWISGGTGSFRTNLKIWRQSIVGVTSDCRAYQTNGEIRVAESVAFDSDENGEGLIPEPCDVTTCIPDDPIVLPSTSLVRVEGGAEVFPQFVLDYATTGWLYLNADDVPTDVPGGHQNWVVISMQAEGRYSVDSDASWLGNGCSPAMPITSYTTGVPVIQRSGPQLPGVVLPGPAPEINP